MKTVFVAFISLAISLAASLAGAEVVYDSTAHNNLYSTLPVVGNVVRLEGAARVFDSITIHEIYHGKGFYRIFVAIYPVPQQVTMGERLTSTPVWKTSLDVSYDGFGSESFTFKGNKMDLPDEFVVVYGIDIQRDVVQPVGLYFLGSNSFTQKGDDPYSVGVGKILSRLFHMGMNMNISSKCSDCSTWCDPIPDLGTFYGLVKINASLKEPVVKNDQIKA